MFVVTLIHSDGWLIEYGTIFKEETRDNVMILKMLT